MDRGGSPRRWPGLRIVAAVRAAFDVQKLILAAVGILGLQLGWSLLDLAFPGSADVTPGLQLTAAAVDFTWTVENPIARLSEPARILTTPLFSLLDPRSGWLTMLHALLAIGWLFVVWGFCGGAIARAAAVQEARLGQPGILAVSRFARRAWVSLAMAPVYPLIAVACCTPAALLLGLLYRIPGGPAVAGVLLFIPLLGGLVMTLLVAALVAGWPMFHASLATGADDALDALSRTYGYLNQRLILFAAGVAIAAAAGLAGLSLVEWLAALVIRLTWWSLSLSGPPQEIAALFGRDPAVQATAAQAAHGFWLGAVRLFARAWAYSYFWSAATAIYLWLRLEVDGTPTSEIDPPGAAA